MQVGAIRSGVCVGVGWRRRVWVWQKWHLQWFPHQKKSPKQPSHLSFEVECERSANSYSSIQWTTLNQQHWCRWGNIHHNRSLLFTASWLLVQFIGACEEILVSVRKWFVAISHQSTFVFRFARLIILSTTVQTSSARHQQLYSQQQTFWYLLLRRRNDLHQIYLCRQSKTL